MEIKAYVTNLGLYNEGILCGEWVTFPIDEDEQKALFERIHIDEEHEEYFMTDYECDVDLNLGEYTSIERINEIAEEIESLYSFEQEAVEALLSGGYDFDQAMEAKDDVICFRNCSTMRDVAEQYADETGLLDSIPENLRYYFDFEAFGRDMDIEGEFIFYNGDCYEVIR